MKVQVAPVATQGYRQITSLGTVKTLADGVDIAGAGPGVPTTRNDYAVIQASGAAVRWTSNGETPTATKGMRIADGGELEWAGDMSALKFIQEAATAQLNITYFRYA